MSPLEKVIMSVYKKPAMRPNDSSSVVQKLCSILRPLDHAQRTEHTNSVIGRLIGKARKLYQIRQNHAYRSLSKIVLQ